MQPQVQTIPVLAPPKSAKKGILSLQNIWTFVSVSFNAVLSLDAFSDLNISQFVSHLTVDPSKLSKEQQLKKEQEEEELKRKREWEIRQKMVQEQAKKVQVSVNRVK